MRGHSSKCLSLGDSPTFLSTPNHHRPPLPSAVVFTHFPVEQLEVLRGRVLTPGHS